MKNKPRNLPTIDFDRMSEQQKEAFYQECERITVEDGRPLTAADRELHAQARRRGRVRRAPEARVVGVSVDKQLLRRADAFARRHGLTRSDLVGRGLRSVMVAAGAA
jgi:hypothetical protein